MIAKLIPLLAGTLGLAAAIALVVHEGFQTVLRVLEVAGWALLLLIPYHLVPLALDAEGWRVLLKPRDPQRRASLPFLLWIATVREAVARLLPVASIGGDLVGVRLALLRPLSGPAVAASVVVEVLLTTVNLCLFTALGLIFLVTLTQSTETSDALFIGLAVTLPAPVVFYVLLRHGGVFAHLERAFLRMVGADSKLGRLFGGAADLDAEIHALLARSWILVQSLLWQLAGMILSSFETWLALDLLGHPVTGWDAVTLESLTLALRHFAFFVPAGIGVQEVGLVLFGNLVGLPSDVSIALSLAKRLREIGCGLPALASWQWVEGWRLRRHASGQTGDPPA